MRMIQSCVSPLSGMPIVVARRSIEGPVACGDAWVVDDGDGTVEDVQGEAAQPTVPVALVELVARVGVTEQARALTHLTGEEKAMLLGSKIFYKF